VRTLVASILVAAALAAALIGWFGAGWSGVQQRELELRAEPRREAEARARELASGVATRLEQLRIAEARRPYYHYQSVFRDPAVVAEGLAVTPSPLRKGPDDPLVRGHFQVMPKGDGWEVRLPTLNDEIPELNEMGNFTADTALRKELVAVADRIASAAAGPAIALPTRVATADPAPRPRSYQSSQVSDSTGTGPGSATTTGSAGSAAPVAAPVTQVIELSPDQYAQNAYSNNAYQQALENQRVIDPKELQTRNPSNPRRNPQMQQQAPQQQEQQQEQAVTPASDPPPPVVVTPPETPSPPAPAPARRRKPEPPRPPERITIAVSPLEWHQTTIGDRPSLIALRRVDTPDGTLTQGLLVDEAAIGEWVADQLPGATLVRSSEARLAPTMVAAAVPIGGWHIELPIGGMDAARSAAATVRSAFWGRFLPIATLAVLCGLMVVVVVARAERFARARSRFAAAAAHELRTPLAGLQLYGDMLSDGLGDPGKAQQYAHRISEEASRLGRVVANVLGFSQLERGDLAVHPVDGDAAAAARDVIERVRPAIERSGMALEVDLPETLPARFDADAVARILGNLIDNAEKYSRGTAEPRTVTLRGKRAGDRVELAVSDSGPGVASGARLFVPFSRGVGADGPAGLGLGLALSRSLARSMGGDLAHVTGATFVLTLASG